MDRERAKMGKKNSLTEKPWFVFAALAGLFIGGLLITSFIRSADDSFFMCNKARAGAKAVSEYSATPIQLQSIVHYATSRTVPQQSFDEISVSLKVLMEKSPCNFLVFGLGHDSLMWASLNPRGTTVFLEEDPDWIATVLKKSPTLRAHHVSYRTRLDEAFKLLGSYRSEPTCSPSKAYPLRDNEKCPLALTGLPDEFYDTQWDLIMIDAPRGYFAAAPGRMAAIFSAAVMARNRKDGDSTHVFLHDVDRKVEKAFAEEFLCKKQLVASAGRLWHFELPSAANMSESAAARDAFC